MSYTDELSDPEWKDVKITAKRNTKQENNTSSKPKYMQKFCVQWLRLFDPWLTRCADDPNKPFCRACQCRLDCNRCHLQRHERTSKHVRNLEILLKKGEGAALENFTIRQERSKYYRQRKHIDLGNDSASDGGMDIAEDTVERCEPDSEASLHFGRTENSPNEKYSDEQVSKQPNISRESVNFANRNFKNHMNTRAIAKRASIKRGERVKLFMQIQKDKNDLMDSFKELIGGRNFSYPPPKEKNHVDLFFDSVSFSVKALSPKLIAEAKMRVSQLICELELRALTESESTTARTNTGTVIVTADSGNSYVVNPQIHQVRLSQENLS